MPPTSSLSDAIAAIQRGENKAAEAILRRIVEQDPAEKRAWLWLSVIASTPDKKREYLHRVLELDPDHTVAKEALERLDGPDAQEPRLEDIVHRPVMAAQMGPFVWTPRMRRLYFGVLAGLMALLVMVCGLLVAYVAFEVCTRLNCFGGGTANQLHTVEYVVNGTANEVLITYGDGDSSYSQEQTSLPWRKTLQMREDAMPSLSAQSVGEGGELSCEIFLDGQAWKSASSNAEYGSVSCGGMIGEP